MLASQVSWSSSGILAATKATPPAPSTRPVGLPLASFSILPPCGSGVLPSILAARQRGAIEIAVNVDRLDDDRVVGGDAVQFILREAARVVGELLFRPAAEDRDPFAGLRRAHAVGEQFQRLLARGDAVEAQLVVFGRADPMGMVVDQARDDGAPAEVDHAGLRTLELVDIGTGADRDDAPAADRQRLGDREAVVDRHDLAVDENGVSVLRPRGQRRSGQQRSDERRGGYIAHVILR